MDILKTNLLFWTKVAVTTPEKCWNWTRAVDTSGYGGFRYKNKKVNSHRVAFELTYGPIPEGMCVCHRCDNRLCCNPHHLFLGTRLDNVRDMDSKGRRKATKGLKFSRVVRKGKKLTYLDILEMRKEFSEGASKPFLAEKYNLHITNVRGIVRGDFWKNLPESDK